MKNINGIGVQNINPAAQLGIQLPFPMDFFPSF